MWYFGFAAIALAIGVLCAWLLYRAAQREGRNPWVWGLAGFLTNVVALVVFQLRVGPIVKH